MVTNMGRIDNSPNGQVVVSKPIKRTLGDNKRLQLIIVAVAVLVLLLGFAGLSVYQRYKSNTAKTNNKIDYSKADSVVQNLIDNDKIAEVQGIGASKVNMDKLINKEKNLKQKGSYLQAKANVCAYYKDFACTLESNDKALKIIGDNASVLIVSGDAAYQSNQKDRGNSYYSRAIIVLQKNPTAKNTKIVEQLQAIISEKPIVGDTQ